MAEALTIVFVIATIITIIILTIYLYYRSLAYSCDASPQIFCYTDWKCDNGTNNALGEQVTDITCHLKALYGAIVGSECPGFTNRSAPCDQASEAGVDTGIPSYCTGNSIDESYSNPYTSCVCNFGDNITSQYSINWDNVSNNPNDSCAGSGCYGANTTACQLLAQANGICT